MTRFTVRLSYCFLIAVCSWACNNDSDDGGNQAETLTTEQCRQLGSEDCGACLSEMQDFLCAEDFDQGSSPSFDPERSSMDRNGNRFTRTDNCSDGGELLLAYRNGYVTRGCGTMEDQDGEGGETGDDGEAGDEP